MKIILYFLTVLLLVSNCSNETAQDYFIRGEAKTWRFLKDSNGKSSTETDNLEAIEDYSKAINIDPNFKDAYYSRGNAKRTIKDFNGAIADYTKLIQIDPQNVKAYFVRGNVKRVLKDYVGAIADFTTAININPNFAIAYSSRGDVKRDIKNYSGAIEDQTKAIGIDSIILIDNEHGNISYTSTSTSNDILKIINCISAYSGRGNAKRDLKDFQGAISDYNIALKIDTKNITKKFDAYFGRGLSKFEINDYLGAIADLTIAIEINPNDAISYYKRGYFKIKIGQEESGHLDIEKAKELGYDKAEVQ